jgi:hypothetical protein
MFSCWSTPCPAIHACLLCFWAGRTIPAGKPATCDRTFKQGIGAMGSRTPDSHASPGCCSAPAGTHSAGVCQDYAGQGTEATR